MDILLISMQMHTDAVGLKYLHSFLLKNKIRSSLLFTPEIGKSHHNAILGFLKKTNPGIVGLTVMAHEFENAKNLTRAIKKGIPDIAVVWGGIYPSSKPEECLDYADYVFVGEAEIFLVEFIMALKNNKPVSGIRNLAYTESGRLHINEKTATKNLDLLPYPEHYPKKSFILHNGKIRRLDKRLFRRYARFSGKLLSVTAQRGCVFKCSFCCNSFLAGTGNSRVRTRSPEDVVEEIKCFADEFPDLIYLLFHDECFFTHTTDWLERFSELYKKKINKRFTVQAIPNMINEKKIRLLKDAGLSWILMGIQSGSERINFEVYDRPVTNHQMLKASRLINRHNIAALYDVILDNPYETEEDIICTIALLTKLPKPYVLHIFSLTLFPGTKLYEKAVKDKIKFEDPKKKRFEHYTLRYLNRVVRLCPLLPKQAIKFLVKSRNTIPGKLFMTILYYPAVFILEPTTWFWAILISFDYNLIDTFKMIFSFAKTGWNIVWMKKPA
ncbi:B12-binding domain-containing radical SAM protein [Candidatus Woesearchaeota archaeon]|nr:B12-binding domain-containing radical SAM protein [Candidatus Woesearchaeota archaeon]